MIFVMAIISFLLFFVGFGLGVRWGFRKVEFDKFASPNGITDLINESGNTSLLLTVENVCKDEIKKVELERDIWEKACELACEDCPCKCPDPVEHYDMRDEYGSDEPVIVSEGGCEFQDHCLECTIKHYYNKAKRRIDNNGGVK